MHESPAAARPVAARITRRAAIGVVALVGVAACGSSAKHSAAALTATYQLHMTFFSTESSISPVIDPQMFAAAPGAPAAVGPQMIRHVADIAPVLRSAPAATALYGADGQPLHITLGTWEAARGTVALTCAGGTETAVSTLQGLVPGGLYSVFVVHLMVNGAGRFTPLGNAAGTDDSFTASATGAADPTDRVSGCLTDQEAVVVIWHSDRQTHGQSPGTVGVTWHNAVIVQVPAS